MENATPIPPDGPEPSQDESLRRGHETRDAGLRPIVIFVVALFVSAVVIQLGVWGLMRHDERRNAAADPTPSPFANDRTPPPEPRLQPSFSHNSLPHEDLAILRARWQKELTSYGLVPGEPGRVRIPVDRAMEIMVEKGFSVPTTLPTTNPSTIRGGEK
jgi:hypothetical protein